MISKPDQGRLVVDAGSKTLALDQGAHGTQTVKGFGIVKGYPDLVISRMSEEHGIIEPVCRDLGLPEVGEKLEIIPNHACTVVNLAECMTVISSGKIIDT